MEQVSSEDIKALFEQSDNDDVTDVDKKVEEKVVIKIVNEFLGAYRIGWRQMSALQIPTNVCVAGGIDIDAESRDSALGSR